MMGVSFPENKGAFPLGAFHLANDGGGGPTYFGWNIPTKIRHSIFRQTGSLP